MLERQDAEEDEFAPPPIHVTSAPDRPLHAIDEDEEQAQSDQLDATKTGSNTARTPTHENFDNGNSGPKGLSQEELDILSMITH